MRQRCWLPCLLLRAASVMATIIAGPSSWTGTPALRPATPADYTDAAGPPGWPTRYRANPTTWVTQGWVAQYTSESPDDSIYNLTDTERPKTTGPVNWVTRSKSGKTRRKSGRASARRRHAAGSKRATEDGTSDEESERGAAPSGPPQPSYGFYRDMRASSSALRSDDARRSSGRRAVRPDSFPTVVALLDRYWAGQCSGAWLARRWVLTAAHCALPEIAYVRYNALRPDREGNIATAVYMFRHPEFHVVQADAGGSRGPDVTELHHDMGLVGTREEMRLQIEPRIAPLTAMWQMGGREMRGQDITVLGFGGAGEGAGEGAGAATRGSGTTAPTEQLYSVPMRLVGCERVGWYHCVCAVGVGAGGLRRGRDSKGDVAAAVCAGDSGGPVMSHGVEGAAQVAITSMGPLQCAGGGAPPDSTAVLTATWPYLVLINETMHAADHSVLKRERAALARSDAKDARPWRLLAPLVALARAALL